MLTENVMATNVLSVGEVANHQCGACFLLKQSCAVCLRVLSQRALFCVLLLLGMQVWLINVLDVRR